jgi:putative aldouronate transport system substrate-binding protein
MMDFLYSNDGMLLTNFGVEGETYEIVDGRPVYMPEITDNPEGLGMHEALVSHGMQWKVGMRQSIDYEAQFANEIAFAARNDYMENYILEAFPTLTFTPEENETITDLFSQIRAYTLENTAKFMVGARPVSEFDDFVAELEDIGLAEVTEIYQAAYDRK